MINYNNTDITILLSAIAWSRLNAIMNLSPFVVIKWRLVDEYSQRKMRIGLRTTFMMSIQGENMNWNGMFSETNYIIE